ncbi:MAG: ATP-binding protein [Pseudomonadota bacterium]
MGFYKHVGAAGLILLLALGLIAFINSPDETRLAGWQVQAPQYAVLESGYNATHVFDSQVDWRDVSLPVDWYRELAPEQSVALRFALRDDGIDQQTVLLTHSARQFSVWLDQERVFKPGRPNHEGRVFTGAHWFIIDRDRQPQASSVTLILPATQSGSATVGRLYVGPAELLVEFGERYNFVKHTLSALIVYTMLLSVLFVFGLWVLRPLDSIYLWYSLAVVAWAIYSYGHIPRSLPFDVRQWDWLRLTALHFWPVLVVVFCNRFTNRPQPFIESLLALYAACTSILTLVLSREQFFLFADAAWPSLSYLIGFYASWIMLRATFLLRAPNVIWMTVCGMLIMLLSLHDIAVIAHWIEPWRGVLLHYSAALLVFVFTSILLQRFVDAFGVAEALNEELSGQVAQKSSEIAHQLTAMRQLEREKALAEERARLMRDMHAGIGGELGSLRAALEQRKMDDHSLRDNLTTIHDELYLMVQSLDTFGDDLGIALGQIRPRLEERVTSAGMKFVFSIGRLPMVLNTSSTVVSNVVRIIQEAVTNAVRHSDADSVEIRVEEAPGCLVLMVIDDGRGLGAGRSSPQAGKGLRNMEQRANRLGGTLQTSASERGTRIVLSLPWDELSTGAPYQRNNDAGKRSV